VVADTLEAIPGRVQLKWPNDLWVDDRKLGGILIEAANSSALDPSLRWVVIGLGLNLWGTPPEWQAERCDMAELGLHGATPDAPPAPGQLMCALVPALLDGARQFEQQGFAAFKDRYARRDALLGRPVNLWTHQAPQAGAPSAASPSPQPHAWGQALGVDAQGALLIHDDLGQTRPWSLGEVSVRPRPDPL
jgi:BirA family biotin operon repressor/biotin-[acetyl-CoA-carboxylase] ligase